jgi:hypothetical protein
MTNTEFYTYLDGGALTVVQLQHTWQYALAIKTCPDDLVEPITVANPKIAAEYARQEAVFDVLDAPNALAVAVPAAGEAEALALIAAASPEVRAEYAAGLGMAEYTQEQLCTQYKQLILGEA